MFVCNMVIAVCCILVFNVSPVNIEISFLETVAGFQDVGAIHEGGIDRSGQADV